ncbi:MAG TPA: restriction endonuclease subunit S [Ktedonobacteraceae bacterium]
MDEQKVAVENKLFDESVSNQKHIQNVFDKIPTSWYFTKLGELCSNKLGIIQTGPFGSQLHASDYKEVGVPVINPTHLGQNTITEDHLPFVAREDAERLARHYLAEGDILIGRRGDFGRNAYITVRQSGWLCGTGCLLIRLKNPKVDNHFLSYYLSTKQAQAYISQNAVGSIMPNINTTILSELPIALPTVSEQRIIARTLRTIQDAIQIWQREVDLERERKAALMQHLFTYGTRGEPTKQTEIGEMPESWQIISLGSKASLITKGSSPNWQGFEYSHQGIVFVRAQNVGWGRLELSDVAYLPEEFNIKEKKSIIRKGDLLITIAGTIGRSAVATEFVEGGNLNQAVAISRLIQDLMPSFVMSFLLTEMGQAQLRGRAKEVVQANLSLQDIAHLQVPFPSSDEQRSIVAGIDACVAKIAALEQEIKLLEELFRALLEELMTGRLSTIHRVAVPLPRP